MARIQSRWYHPYTVDSVEFRGTNVRMRLRFRRWHPALWWMAMRMVEPRYLWRPDAWLTIVRACWKAGRTA